MENLHPCLPGRATDIGDNVGIPDKTSKNEEFEGLNFCHCKCLHLQYCDSCIHPYYVCSEELSQCLQCSVRYWNIYPDNYIPCPHFCSKGLYNVMAEYVL